MERLTYCHPGFRGRIGVAREDITPPVGIYARNWGAAEHDVAEGIYRPLTLTAVAICPTTPGDGGPPDPPITGGTIGHSGVLRSDESDRSDRSDTGAVSTRSPQNWGAGGACLLLSADLGWWRTAEDEWFVRRAVLEALGLDPAQLMIAFSHTHSGPSICREDSDKPGGHLIGSYLECVRDVAVAAARRAVDSVRPAVLEWTYGRCCLARNRDLPDPDSDRIVCGFNPDAPADDTLLVGRVTAESGEPLAILVNYACHPVTLAHENRFISPDWVGALRETVEFGSGAPCLFFQGASGELAPARHYSADLAVADSNGRAVGYAALSVFAGMLPPRMALRYDGVVESGAPLAMWRLAEADPSDRSDALEARLIEVDLPLKPDLPSLCDIENRITGSGDRVMRERLVRLARVRRMVGDGSSARIPVWVWRVGDAILVGQANEAYSNLQTELRARFPGRPIVVMNLVNGACGYLPPSEMYERDQYQAWQTPFAPGSLELLIEACASGIEDLLTDSAESARGE